MSGGSSPGIDLAEWGAYLSTHLGPCTVLSAERAYPGHSRVTWLVQTAEHGGLVLRVDHPGGPLVPLPMALEYAVYERLWGTEVPVAEPLFYAEATPFAQGRPHMVRRMVDGSSRIAGLTGSPSDDPARRRAVCLEVASKLALVHTLDWKAAGFGADLFVPASPESALHDELAQWRDLFRNARSGPFPVLMEATWWLEESIPAAPTRLCLLKGNNGLGEEIWRDGRIVALSDWELAEIGDPSLDWAFSQGILAMHDPEETLAHYAGCTGFAIDRELLAWATVWIRVKASMTTHGGLAAFMSGTDGRMVRAALGIGHIRQTERWVAAAMRRDVTDVGLELLAATRNAYVGT